jgi:DNA polymerase I-like protein with 3'-5' exonuclease and polymerase domains/uracil-DNA glycosylase
MISKPIICKDCPWATTSIGYIPPYGTTRNGIAITSDYPELGDIEVQKPLSTGRAGDMISRLMERLKEKRENYGIDYLVHCKPKFTGKVPKGRFDLSDAEGWEQAAEYCDRVHTRGDRLAKTAKVIIPLGATALEAYSGLPANDNCRGYVYKSERYGRLSVIGTYHPYMVGAGNTGYLFTMRYDFANALHKSSPDFGTATKHFIQDPTPQEFSSFVDKVIANSSWCVVDIETSYAQHVEDESKYSKIRTSFNILRVSFCASHDTDTSVSVNWMPQYFPAIKRLLSTKSLDIVYWNGDYDDPRLEFNGFARAGRFIDAMWLWHFLQPDLPKALAHVSTYFTDLQEWKSLSQLDPAYYSCCDAYAEAKNYEAIVASLKQKGMWEIAERHVTELLGVLRGAIARGMQTDPIAITQVKEILSKRLEEWNDRIKEKHPDEAKKIRWYKKAPPGVKKGIVFSGMSKTIGGKEGMYIQVADKWGFREDFNPNSPAQLKEYLRYCGIKIPRKHKTHKESTDDKALNRIYAQTGNELVKEVIDRAKTAKVFSTYTNWPIDEKDKVHPVFQLTPATGRLSCERPNFQNLPKEGELADLIRSCVIARPGYILITADYVGMESLLTGYFAEDSLYMLLSTMNIYAYIVAKHQGWPLPINEGELRTRLLEYKKKAKSTKKAGEIKTLYDKFKTIVLAIGYGAGRDTIFYQNPGLFADLAEAGQLRQFVLDTFPAVRDWQQKIVTLARQGYLYNPFKYVRYFLDCPGSDSSTAMAQQPQSTGAAIVKECLLQFHETWLGGCFILQVHDEIGWEVPIELKDNALLLIRNIMEQPWKELGGLSIKVTTKCGYNLRDMKEVTNG